MRTVHIDKSSIHLIYHLIDIETENESGKLNSD